MKLFTRLSERKKRSGSMSNRSVGDWGEREAARYLKRQGYKLLERNWQVRMGEIDIIAQKDKEIVFVEVKSSSTLSSIAPEYRVGTKKQRKLRTLAQAYLQNKTDEPDSVRFDVISLWREAGETKLRHIENAF